MSILVDSLRRLYLAGSIHVTEAKIQELRNDGRITEEEYNYILA